jgi:hypothetical protein
MMDANYIAEQCTAIHADNRAKGFWENPRSAKINNGLRLSEMVEAFEGIRSGKNANAKGVQDCFFRLSWINAGSPSWNTEYAHLYRNLIKDSIEAEVAGTCIRCFDLLGGRLYEGGGVIMDGYRETERLDLAIISEITATKIADALVGAKRVEYSTMEIELERLAECLVDFMPAALGIVTGGEELDKMGLAARVTEVVAAIETLKNMCLLSVWFGIDLKAHIALEVAYNRTRTHKHGGRLF